MIGGDQNNSNLTSDEHHAATSPDVVAESGDTTDEEKANNIITNNTTNTDDKDEGVVSEEKGATDDNTSSTVIKYASNPLKYSIVFILILDFLERFAFNGIIFTMPIINHIGIQPSRHGKLIVSLQCHRGLDTSLPSWLHQLLML